MDIPSKKVFDKMEELVYKAKSADSEEKRTGFVMAIQALCDVLVEQDEKPVIHKRPVAEPVREIQEISTQTLTAPIQSFPQAKPVKMGDANGESLFDF